MSGCSNAHSTGYLGLHFSCSNIAGGPLGYSVCQNDMLVMFSLQGGACSGPPPWGIICPAIRGYPCLIFIYSGCFFFEFVVIMSQVAVTFTTTTQHVTVVCSRVFLITMTVASAPTSVGQMMSGHRMWFCPPQLICGKIEEFCWPHTFGTNNLNPAQDAFSGICQLFQGFSTGQFLFSELSFPLILISCFGVYYGVYLLLSSCHVAAMFIYGGSTFWGLHHYSPLELTHGKHMCLLIMVNVPCQECAELLPLPLLPFRGILLLLISLLLGHVSYMVGPTDSGGSAVSHLIPPPSLYCGRGFFFR